MEDVDLGDDTHGDPPTRRQKLIAFWELWFAFNPGLIGLLLGGLISVILGLFLYVPIGRATRFRGVVDHALTMQGRYGYYSIVFVKFNNHEALLDLPLYSQCKPGGSIIVIEQQYIFRIADSAAWPPCAMR